MMNKITHFFFFDKLKACFVCSYILISLFFFSFNVNAKEKNLTDYNELLDDTSVPITIGIDGSFGISRVRDAIVPNRKDLNDPAYCNAFAFLVGNTDNSGASNTVIPTLYMASIVFHVDSLILDRNIWKIFNAYPSIGFDIIYKQFVPGFPDFFGIYSGQFMGAGISLEIYKEYWADHILFPRISLSGGLFDAPINNSIKSKILSHPKNLVKVSLNGKKSPNKKFEGAMVILGLGGGWKYNINNKWSFNLKVISEYMFAFPTSKRHLVENNNAIRPETFKDENNKPIKKPKKGYMFFDNLLISCGLSYCFNPAKSRYKRFDPPKDSTGLEVGILTTSRKINAMSKIESKLMDKETPSTGTPPRTPSATPDSEKIDMSASFIGFGIYGTYSFKSDWLRENINTFVFDNVSFILGSELMLMDSAVKNKSKKAKQAVEDSSKLSIMAGLGFNDTGLIKLKLLLGYDIVSFDYWGEEKSEQILGRFFISPELQIALFDKLGITFFNKIRPTKNVSSKGGGGLFKIFDYDCLFYEVGIKIGYMF